ncbi:leucine-rich repeat-containing protein 24-like [Parasteatoda tepidariorum]|uniref:leucine-rich repeat-containing protein 24-like n=1 Tax=Parasteatoda tepidariorum TaxID=114398 RepID=UPI00077FA148|nr:leucine-rich repeat-containing protein 4C-like [Parasteatoda tepidariorum]
MHEVQNPVIVNILFLILFGITISQIDSLKDACLSECNCKWKNGKQTVECIGVNLVGIPDGLSSETQVLDLTGNLLQLLPSRAFYRVSLVNLQKVFAPRCGLLSIADDAFYQLSNLIELDISNNFLTWIPSVALRDTPLLRRLLLSFNPIQRVENDSFSLQSHLTVLELSSCQIEAIEPRAFDGLKSLEYLKLDGNKLRTLPPEMVKPFSTLYALELHQNPWQCDCHIRSVRKWMLRHNIPISSPPQCFEPPRLREFTWDTVSIDEFACKPEVTVVESSVTYIEGDNATLGCRVQAVPEGTVNWIWRGRVISNLTLMSFGRQMYLIREVGTTLKVNSLTIFNVMLKDSGRYLCVASNPAGRISANITLNVVPRDTNSDNLSGEEIAGIVIGVLFVIFALFFVFSFFMMRHQRLFQNRNKSNSFPFYKNFFSFNNNHVGVVVKNSTGVDLSMNANGSNLVDGKCNASPLSPCSGSEASVYSGNKVNNLPFEQYSVHESNSPNTQPSPNSEKWYPSTLNRHSIRETETGIEMCVISKNENVNPDDKSFKPNIDSLETAERTEYRRPITTDEKDDDLESAGPMMYDIQQPINDYYMDHDLPSHKCSIWPLSEGSFKDESYHSYNSPSQSSWKRSSVIIPQQIHHIFSPDARDSPDEGLGDEREYETDILD